MIKKSLVIALLTASALIIGCSSDDDDPTDGTTTAAADAGAVDAGAADAGAADAGAADAGAADAGAADAGAADAGAADAGAADAGAADAGAADGGATDAGAGGTEYNANSVMGLIAADARLSTLAGALNPDFDQSLDTANQNWTVFAPTNEALQAAIDAGAEVTGTVLQSHIYTQGAVASSALSPGQVLSMSNNSMYTITAGDGGGLLINGIAIIEADLPADNGALHIIDGVLIPNN